VDCVAAAAPGSLRGHRRDDVLALVRCLRVERVLPMRPDRARMIKPPSLCFVEAVAPALYGLQIFEAEQGAISFPD
jgi:hypothetical protein